MPQWRSAVWSVLSGRALTQQGALDNARAAVQRDAVQARERREALHATDGAAAASPLRRPGLLLPPLGGGSGDDQAQAVCGGVVLTEDDAQRAADVSPVEGFVGAAEIALALLQQRRPLDLWCVTRTRDEVSTVLVARGRGGLAVPPGTMQPWAHTYCRLMVAGLAPRSAPRSREVPAYAQCLATEQWGIAAYVGVPLLAPDGTLFGTLCGLSTEEQGDDLHEALPDLEQVARLLSTVLAKEAAALERSQAAAQAYALLDRDAETGLLNRRAWQSRLLEEEERGLRTGSLASVLVLRLRGASTSQGERGDDPRYDRRDAEALRRVAHVVARVCRPADVCARTGAEEVSLLAVDCDSVQARSLAARLTRSLAAEGTPVQVSCAGRSRRLDLVDAWRRAQSFS